MNNLINKNEIAAIKEWLGTGSINIFGRPFSGKDTQAKKLANIFNASIIGGGDIIRSNPRAQEVSTYVGSGKLAPQDAYLSLVLPYLAKQDYISTPLILSSLGRWHGEEKPIMEAAKKSNHEIKAVICLDIPEEEVMRRWQAAKQRGDRGNRNDDNPNSIKTRLKEYNEKTLPVLSFYNEQQLLIVVNGTQSAELVTQQIIDGLLTQNKRS